MTHEIKLKPFTTPNFAIFERLPGKRQDGITFDGEGIPIAELSADALFQLCEKFIKDVYQKAGKTAPTLVKTACA